MSFLKDTANVKKCKMKKEYFKPVTVTVELNVESYILNDSNRIPVGGQDKPSIHSLRRNMLVH